MVSDRAFKITGVDLGGCMVKDGARAIAFHRDVLGMEPTRVHPGGMGAECELSDGILHERKTA
jgi:hypothetical protein